MENAECVRQAHDESVELAGCLDARVHRCVELRIFSLPDGGAGGSGGAVRSVVIE
ncbi:unnamed protein product [Toxocara canis]|uniref:FolB domain-containing protein n=1 Tax=Toxocara canis TaxID=6265 RepID=A0A183UAR0_TOXCA|nr:unnamed protein product [Toxocara canis]